jgi:hypothetical protein
MPKYLHLFLLQHFLRSYQTDKVAYSSRYKSIDRLLSSCEYPLATRLTSTGSSPSLLTTMKPVEFPSNSESLVTVSKAHEYVWVVELHNGADNRLTGPMCDALSQALDLVETQWRDRWRPTFYDKNDTEKVNASGALILVANRKQEKFFSNGFDFPKLLKEPHFIPSKLNISSF